MLNTRCLDALGGLEEFFPGSRHGNFGLGEHFRVGEDEPAHGQVHRDGVGLSAGLAHIEASGNEVVQESLVLLDVVVEGHDVAVVAESRSPESARLLCDVRGGAGEEISSELLLQIRPLEGLDGHLDLVFLLKLGNDSLVRCEVVARRKVEQDFLPCPLA